MTKDKHIYRIIFIQDDTVYEMYAKSIVESDIFGFIEIEEFIFGKNTTVVVDPSEERLKLEFKDVKRSYIPMQAIIRIDEVSKEGTVKVKELKSGAANVSHFPSHSGSKHDKT